MSFQLNQFIQPKEFILVLIIASLATLVMCFAPESTHLLRYQGDISTTHQYWRLVTANFTHNNWNHWLLNLTGLIMIDYLFQPLVKQTERAKVLIFCILFNVTLIHWFMTVNWYVGLSGALHGFLLGCALLCWHRVKFFSSLVIVIVVVKLVAELNWDINEFTANLIASNVLEQAHLAGAVAGGTYAFTVSLWRMTLTQRITDKTPN